MTSDGHGPCVSVIMPVFNAGAYVTEALASVAAQTYRDYEVVIVDDGSTEERTLAALDRARGAPRTTVIRTENRGPAAARNLAIERTRGAYILPLDADDYLAPAYLARTVPVLDASPDVGVVYTWVGLVGSHHGVWRTGGFTLQELLSRCTIHVTSLYRRRIWSEVGGYDPRFVESSEDWDLWLGAAALGWTGRCVPEVLAYYRRHARSREVRARTPEGSAQRMRLLVSKHRALYEAHLERGIGDLYAQLVQAGVALERIYHHPAIRLAVRLRAFFRPSSRP